MRIREAMGQIATLDSRGNRPGSDRQSTGFTNEVANILRTVGEVEERPNGANGYPTFILNGVSYQVKTAKGKKPMWNEVYVRTNSVLILNLSFGTIVVHGSLITNTETEEMLIEAKNYAAAHLRERFPHNENQNFYISGGRIQFGDNVNWEDSKISFLQRTIRILEGE